MHRIQRKLEGEMPIYFELIINQNIISPSLELLSEEKKFSHVLSNFLVSTTNYSVPKKNAPLEKLWPIS